MATEIRAGLNKPYPALINEAKEGLKEKSAVELHGLGGSITSVIRAADLLTSQGYAKLTSFHTFSLSDERSGESRMKPKVVISLAKSSTFDKAYQDFESQKKGK